VSYGEIQENELLRLAASLEGVSEHPLAAAVISAATERKLQPSSVNSFEYFPGKGVTGIVDGRSIALGNQSLLQDLEVDAVNVVEQAAEFRRDGQTVMFAVVDGRVVGLLCIEDPIKPTAQEAVAQLHREGIATVMLTGDSDVTAKTVAKKIGIDKVIAEVLPDEKVDVVKSLQSAGAIVAMAGDGINDAPALAQADVGIAMGTGTDVAMKSADVTLVKGDLLGIVRARVLSRKTMANIKQNLFFAFVYNSLGVPLAAGVLYPFFGVLLSPMIAAAAMSFSSVSVIANALRLRRATI
jgi:Cu+-exporting ATPase